MITSIKQLMILRVNLLKKVNELSEEQLLFIPDGWNNNILWHLGHLVVTEQILIYKLSDTKMYIPEEYLSLFRKGTSPRDWESQTHDITKLKDYFISLPEKLLFNYDSEQFNQYSEYETSSGIVLKTVEDAIAYNFHHEGLHQGFISSMIKLV